MLQLADMIILLYFANLYNAIEKFVCIVCNIPLMLMSLYLL